MSKESVTSVRVMSGKGGVYSAAEYYGTVDFQLVYEAHQTIARQYRAEELEKVAWYWRRTEEEASRTEYRRESVGPFTLHSGPLTGLPLPLVVLYLDSQIKTYMDRDVLGDAVRQRAPTEEAKSQDATRIARERELARRIGGGSLENEDLQMVLVEYGGYVISGMMVNPGKRDETVGAILRSPDNGSSIAALQAKYNLEAGDPFLAVKENEIADLIRYFRVPADVLRRLLPPQLLEKELYRVNVHLIRALTISEAFAVTKRWMETKGRKITTGVCETPTGDVKLLFEGRKVKTVDGQEKRVGDIPHRILTTATGLELYPVAYENRPEGRTKIYTLYAFDFEEIVLRAKVYREQAVAACRWGVRHQG